MGICYWIEIYNIKLYEIIETDIWVVEPEPEPEPGQYLMGSNIQFI